MEKISNCCSAKVFAPTDTWAICIDCKEPCGIVEMCNSIVVGGKVINCACGECF